MADDWNTKVIEDFRAHEGRVGPPIEGQPIVLVHHSGRKSGKERVSPMMYKAGDDGVLYVFASRAGSAKNPDWYYNLVAGGPASVEVGTDSYPVTVTELEGEERDRVYAEQAAAYPAFQEYADKLKGVRTIPVLALRRR